MGRLPDAARRFAYSIAACSTALRIAPPRHQSSRSMVPEGAIASVSCGADTRVSSASETGHDTATSDRVGQVEARLRNTGAQKVSSGRVSGG